MNINSIIVVSDIHFEFDSTLSDYNNFIGKKYADAIILAGDVHVGKKALPFVEHLLSLGYIVFYVMGNHEYYTHDIGTIDNFWKSVDLENFYFLQNDVEYFDNVRIIGATMWASAGTLQIHPIHGTVYNENVDWFVNKALKNGINDFHVIKNFTVTQMAYTFKESSRYIFNEVEKSFDGKTIVVTHHAPSEKSSLPQFAGNTTNHGFYSPLDVMIEDSSIDVWIHGHMHNSSDYMIGETRVICNPRGYKDVGGENWHFEKFKTIKV